MHSKAERRNRKAKRYPLLIRGSQIKVFHSAIGIFIIVEALSWEEVN